MGTTLDLAPRVVETKLEDISTEAIERAKELLIQFVGTCISGSQTLPGKIMSKYVRDMEARAESTVIGCQLKTVAPYAAFANATLCHCDELEDVGMRGAFAATHLLAVALALGEKLGASGKDVLEGYILGHEIQGRVSIACLPASIKRVSPFKYGFLGCAGVAGKMMKLDADGVAMAIAMAASQAGGLAPTSGTMSHYLDFRSAARSGIEAALLVKEGITARKDILEGEHCFLDEMVGPGDYDLEAMTAEWGKHFQCTAVSIKKYPACYLSHRALDNLLDLMEQNDIAYEDIESVQLDTGLLPVQWMRFDEPANIDEARFSFKHVLGTAILKQEVWLDSFTEAAVNDPKLREAYKKVKVVLHPEWPTGRTALGTTVAIELWNGKVISRESGDLREPTREEILGNYGRLTQTLLTPAKQERSLELMLKMEKLENISELMGIV